MAVSNITPMVSGGYNLIGRGHALSGGNATEIPLEVASVIQWNGYRRHLFSKLECPKIPASSNSRRALGVVDLLLQ